jgi:hypothetical protein
MRCDRCKEAHDASDHELFGKFHAALCRPCANDWEAFFGSSEVGAEKRRLEARDAHLRMGAPSEEELLALAQEHHSLEQTAFLLAKEFVEGGTRVLAERDRQKATEGWSYDRPWQENWEGQDSMSEAQSSDKASKD